MCGAPPRQTDGWEASYGEWVCPSCFHTYLVKERHEASVLLGRCVSHKPRTTRDLGRAIGRPIGRCVCGRMAPLAGCYTDPAGSTHTARRTPQ